MRRTKIAVVGLVVVLLVTAHQTGVLARLVEPAQLRESLLELGGWGYLAFVLAYAALQPFGVPGTVFVMAAPLVWSWPVAFALSMTGTMAASVVGFSFARFVARDWVSPRIPQSFRKYDEALARRALPTVFVLRLIFWMPPLLHAFFGVSRVPFTTHFWGSFLGYLLPLFLVSFFGQRLFDTLRALSPATWAALALTAAVLAALVWAVRKGTRPT